MSCHSDNRDLERRTQKMLGGFMRKYRLAQGLTVQQVADRCGLERSNLCYIESGKENITIRMLCRICLGLGIDPRELLCGANKKDVSPKYGVVDTQAKELQAVQEKNKTNDCFHTTQ